LFHILVSTGAFIMKLDPVEISDDINSNIDKVTDKVNQEVTDAVKTSTQEIVEKTKEEIESKMKEK
ncbi:MAG: membrane protein required for colicin V production, partial [Sulfurimonas sp.]